MIKKFESFTNKELFKSKDELDNMSKSEINLFKSNFIRNMGYDGKVGDNDDSRKYLKEFDIYYDIRFKEDIFDRYSRWIKTYNSDKEGNQDLKLVVDILTKDGGPDSLYKLRISSSIKSIGTFDYIKGIKTE